MSDPTTILLQGARILETELRPQGFDFVFRAAGKGSGGLFATGDFIRDERRLELHFRESLGLVRYHIGTSSAAHETYMRELGVRHECRYPGFSDDPLVAFHDLAHDLKFAADFTTGDANMLLRAAAVEAQVRPVGRPALP
jgi:hypothetical protein